VPHIIPLILGIVATASTVGTQIAGAVSGPSGGPPQATPTPAPAAAPATPSTDSLKAAITPQALNIESLTGGSVSPDYLSTIFFSSRRRHTRS